jgi:hypothetical protein
VSEKKIVKKHSKDQEKHNHREAFKGHKTRKHFITSVKAEEAEQDIVDSTKPDRHGE